MTISRRLLASVGLLAALALPSAAGAAVFSGTVYSDANQNGVQDAGEAGVAGLPVDWDTGSDQASPTSNPGLATTTDASGRYSLNLPSGQWGWLHVRTGWFRSKCASTYCSAFGGGDNFITDNEQLWSGTYAVSSSTARTLNAGLTPDAGQYFAGTGNNAGPYGGYPPNLGNAHQQDLSVRATTLSSSGCHISGGVACPLGHTIQYAADVFNSGLTAVSGITLVAQLPYGQEFQSATLLPGLSSTSATSVTVTSVAPATQAYPASGSPTAGSFSVIRMTLNGSVPAAGLAYIRINAYYRSGSTSSRSMMFGITGEANGAADTDSQFCSTPAVPSSCPRPPATTHSLLDRVSDDTDGAGLKILQ